MTDQKLLKVFKPATRKVNVRKYLSLLKNHYHITYEHSLRVGLLCVYLGYENNLSDEEIKLLCYAGLLHDVGKLFVPVSILSKKSRLTEGEWKKVKEHPREGFLLLKESEFEKVKKIIVMHHEYCNCPYPRNGNLKNKPIKKTKRCRNGFKELAQILSAADMYDALSHARAYHEPLGCDDIKKTMKEQFKGKRKFINQLMKKCLIDFNENSSKNI